MSVRERVLPLRSPARAVSARHVIVTANGSTSEGYVTAPPPFVINRTSRKAAATYWRRVPTKLVTIDLRKDQNWVMALSDSNCDTSRAFRRLNDALFSSRLSIEEVNLPVPRSALTKQQQEQISLCLYDLNLTSPIDWATYDAKRNIMAASLRRDQEEVSSPPIPVTKRSRLPGRLLRRKSSPTLSETAPERNRSHEAEDAMFPRFKPELEQEMTEGENEKAERQPSWLGGNIRRMLSLPPMRGRPSEGSQSRTTIAEQVSAIDIAGVPKPVVLWV